MSYTPYTAQHSYESQIAGANIAGANIAHSVFSACPLISIPLFPGQTVIPLLSITSEVGFGLSKLSSHRHLNLTPGLRQKYWA
jgi:hypothetical protein